MTNGYNFSYITGVEHVWNIKEDQIPFLDYIAYSNDWWTSFPGKVRHGRSICNFPRILWDTLHWVDVMCGLCCQKQVSQTEICNCTPQYSVGCNYLSMLEIPAYGNKILIYTPIIPRPFRWVVKYMLIKPFLRMGYIFSCDQAALWMVFSVHLSVCPSVTPFLLCSHHRIIMKFSGVITLDQGKVHVKGQGQRSKVKVIEVTTQIFVSGL